MQKKRPFLSILLLASLATAATADDAVSVPGGIPSLSTPEIRTEADLRRGRDHVQSVVSEIKGFFDTVAAAPQVLSPVKTGKPAAPQLTVIPEPDGRATLIYRSRYTSAKKIFRAIDGIAAGSAMIDVIDKNNTILINDKASLIEYYKQTLLAVDAPSPQILIEAKVVEVLFTDGMDRNLSLNFAHGDRGSIGASTSSPGATSSNGLTGNWSIIGGEDNLSVSFQWLLSAQDAKVLSSPNILVSLNEVARIVTGQDIPIQSSTINGNTQSISTTFKRVGVSLEVEPQIINPEDVTLRVFPQVTTVLRYEQIATGSGDGKVNYSVPVISVRNVESNLRMQDKQVVVIGGLYSSRDSLQEERTPILSDIPAIGELFTGKSKQREIIQLVFFMKIHIVPPEMVQQGYTFDPGYQARSTEAVGDFVQRNIEQPEHTRGVSGLATEMKESLPKSWLGDKQETLQKRPETDPLKKEEKNKAAAAEFLDNRSEALPGMKPAEKQPENTAKNAAQEKAEKAETPRSENTAPAPAPAKTEPSGKTAAGASEK